MLKKVQRLFLQNKPFLTLRKNFGFVKDSYEAKSRFFMRRYVQWQRIKAAGQNKKGKIALSIKHQDHKINPTATISKRSLAQIND